MSTQPSNQNSVIWLLLLLFIPAYDGIERADVIELYIEDIQTLLADFEGHGAFDPRVRVPNENDISDSENDGPVFGDDGSSNVKRENSRVTNDESITNDANDENAAAIANNEFNLARSRCGLNSLVADPELAAVAIQHANYIKYVFANATPTVFNPHYQMDITDIASVTSRNNPYFSGLDVKNRMFNANYPNLNYGITENIAQTRYYHSAGRLISPTTATISMAKSLLAAPYHLRSLTAPSSQVVGTAMVGYKPYDKEPRNNQGYVLVSNAAATQATKNVTVSGVFTYPCQGVTGTVTGLYNETPDPVQHTGRNLSTDPIGQPIYINAPQARRIQITNINFYDIDHDIKLPTQILNYQNDPYKNTEYELPENEAFILPITDQLNSCNRLLKKEKNCGLHGNSEYRVSFDIILDNNRVQRQSFSFMTGEVNES